MDLCLITCNIRFDNPADGLNSWQYRRDFLTQTLLKYGPSIIATQEGRFHQLNELKVLLNDYDLSDYHRSWIGERMYPTIFLKQGHFEHLRSGDNWLSETPDVAGSISFGSTFPRLMTWCEVQVKNSDQKLMLIDTHLDHMKSLTREGQVEVLIQQIQKIWDPNSFLVIMGDFNDSPESKVRELLTLEFHLTDAWKLFNSKEETSHHAFKGEMQNGSRIDWILTDPRLKVKSCIMDKSVDGEAYPTDHFPIVCTITL